MPSPYRNISKDSSLADSFSGQFFRHRKPRTHLPRKQHAFGPYSRLLPGHAYPRARNPARPLAVQIPYHNTVQGPVIRIPIPITNLPHPPLQAIHSQSALDDVAAYYALVVADAQMIRACIVILWRMINVCEVARHCDMAPLVPQLAPSVRPSAGPAKRPGNAV